MGLMELGCKLEAFGRLAQPAASNRLRCRAQVVSERYLREAFRMCEFVLSCLCVVSYVNLIELLFFREMFLSGYKPALI